MSALPLPSAATSCFADKACCADGVGTTLTVRPARRKSPSLMPMYKGASATPGGATTVMVPDAAGPEPADDPVPGNWQPATRIRPVTLAATPAAQRARLPHWARSGPTRSLITLLGGMGDGCGHFGTGRSARQYPTGSERSAYFRYHKAPV